MLIVSATFLIVVALLLAYSFLPLQGEKRGWPWFSRVLTVSVITYISLVLCPWLLGNELEADSRAAMLLFQTNLAVFGFWPAAGAVIGWLTWHVPLARRRIEELWLWLFQKDRASFGSSLPQGFMVGWALFAGAFAIACSYSIY